MMDRQHCVVPLNPRPTFQPPHILSPWHWDLVGLAGGWGHGVVGAQGRSGSAPAGSGQALSQRQGWAPGGQSIEEGSVRLQSRSQDQASIPRAMASFFLKEHLSSSSYKHVSLSHP